MSRKKSLLHYLSRIALDSNHLLLFGWFVTNRSGVLRLPRFFSFQARPLLSPPRQQLPLPRERPGHLLQRISVLLQHFRTELQVRRNQLVAQPVGCLEQFKSLPTASLSWLADGTTATNLISTRTADCRLQRSLLEPSASFSHH